MAYIVITQITRQEPSCYIVHWQALTKVSSYVLHVKLTAKATLSIPVTRSADWTRKYKIELVYHIHRNVNVNIEFTQLNRAGRRKIINYVRT